MDVNGIKLATNIALKKIYEDIKARFALKKDLDDVIEKIQKQPGTDGAPGKSAYEIAIEKGFEGTEEEWLASLKGSRGPQGEAGQQGEAGAAGETGRSATVKVGTVTSGEEASVENVGTPTDAILNFVIPQIKMEEVAPKRVRLKQEIKTTDWADGSFVLENAAIKPDSIILFGLPDDTTEENCQQVADAGITCEEQIEGQITLKAQQAVPAADIVVEISILQKSDEYLSSLTQMVDNFGKKVAGISTILKDGTCSKEYVDQKITALVDSAPEQLDTLQELSKALNNDGDFATTVNNTLAQKLDKAGGTIAGDLTVEGALNAKASSVDWANVAGKPETFAPSTHTHWLLNSELGVTLDDTAEGGWSLLHNQLNTDSEHYGHVLKSIRTANIAPDWLMGDYGSGIVFGGIDTHGVMSVCYHDPIIKFAGGNGLGPNWWMGIYGASGKSYNLESMVAIESFDASTGSLRLKTM